MSELKIKWPQVVGMFIPVCRWIDLCNGTMFRIGAFFTSQIFDGPREGLFVSIERMGSFLFDIEKPKSADYVSEKLNIGLTDAANIADWINAQNKHDVVQQGKYFKGYYESIEACGNIGERKMYPLIPELIEGN